MSIESWAVKKPSGEELGLIKKLTIDPKTRQIAYADVQLGDTGQVVLLPWELFQVTPDTILLHAAEEHLMAAPILTKAAASTAPVTLEVATTVPGRIRQNKKGVRVRTGHP